MKKSNVLWLIWKKNKLHHQMWRVMKLTCILCTCFVWTLSANVMSQQKVSMNLGKVSLKVFFEELRKQTNKIVIYNDDRLELQQKVDADFVDLDLKEALDKILSGCDMTYRMMDDYIVLARRLEDVKKGVTVKGWVYDKKKNPLPGVTVRIGGLSLGTVTNAQGWFSLDLPMQKGTLEFSFVGYKKQQQPFTIQTDTLKVFMEEEQLVLDEAVITGIFNKPKESFTGAVKAITKDDIKMHYSRNLLQTLANIDPSLRIVQNNEDGSNPNVLPEIQLRGASTMLNVSDLENQASRPEYNQPLFIMDGFEVDLERVNDLNENEIESINILKDASATAMYGSRGANGVVVITTNRLRAGNLRVMYEGRINVQIPDFSTYDNLMSAAEKFELEKRYGVWDNLEYIGLDGRTYQEYYDEIQDAINRGVNYNWLKEPTRTGVGQTHILRFMGGAEAWTYGIDLSYQSTLGAMKGSDRKNFNGTLSLGYNLDKWNIRQSLSIATNKSANSPYGEFSSYVNMNRYWEPYGKDGKVVDDYYHPLLTYQPKENPLYDKKVGVWNETKYFNVRSNTQVRYDIFKGFYTTLTFGLNRKTKTADTFYPPSHKNFATVTELDQKGSYSRGETEETTWELRGTLNYAGTFNEKHMLTVGISGELSETSSDNVSWTATGFVADNIDHPGTALGYPSTGHPFGDNSLSRRVGIMASVNYYYDRRYFVDATINYNGSSSFGENSRFSPYYSFGGGWLMSNEAFIQNHVPFINEWRWRYSVGIAGNMVLNPNEYMEVFNRNSTSTYLDQISWNLANFANPDLKQQNTLQHNVGVDITLFNSRVNVSLNYYNKLTNNVIEELNLPISHGFNTITGNVGKIRNEGFEGYVNIGLYRNSEKNIRWDLNANFSKLRNTIVKLSEGYKAQMLRGGGHQYTMSSYQDIIKYQEGKSLDAIYGLRTVGVDPMSGQRVYLKADGVTTTLEQNAKDLVYLGDRQPKINSTINTSFWWKGFDISIGFGIKWGGKQVNSTELTKGENIYLVANLDRRVLEYGWFEIGDRARYKNQYGGNVENTSVCDDFVQRDNVFSLNNINLRYQFPGAWLRRTLKLESLSVAASLSDIFYFSTIERERGTSYPFSINPNFSISCTF